MTYATSDVRLDGQAVGQLWIPIVNDDAKSHVLGELASALLPCVRLIFASSGRGTPRWTALWRLPRGEDAWQFDSWLWASAGQARRILRIANLCPSLSLGFKDAYEGTDALGVSISTSAEV